MKDCELFMTLTWKSRNAVEDTQTAVVTARRNTRRETGSDGTENGIWNNGFETRGERVCTLGRLLLERDGQRQWSMTIRRLRQRCWETNVLKA